MHESKNFRTGSKDEAKTVAAGGVVPARGRARRQAPLFAAASIGLGLLLAGPAYAAADGEVPLLLPAASVVLLAVGFFGSILASLRGERTAETVDTTGERLREVEAELAQVRAIADERKLALETADRRHAELVREVNHRIKNNLQVILSLLSLQTSRTQQPDARGALNEARQRISALALIHRHLYDSPDFQSLDFKSFANELLRHLTDVAGSGPAPAVATRIEAPSLRITADQAVPVALLVTEAVAQAMSHSFPAGRSCEIVVGLTEQGGTATLEIRDNGVSHAETAAATPGSLAALLIAGYVRQLQGRLEVQDRAPGTAVVVSFAWRPPEEAQRPPAGSAE